jgi:hypothetical protein
VLLRRVPGVQFIKLIINYTGIIDTIPRIFGYRMQHDEYSFILLFLYSLPDHQKSQPYP